MAPALPALVPLAAVLAFVFSTMAVYGARTLLVGRAHERYIEERPRSFLSKFFQEWWIRLFTPVERACLALRITPDAITLASTAFTALAGALLASGRLSLGGWIFLLASSLDFIDGRVARASGQASRAGAFLDSTLDRVGELCVLGGLAIAFRDGPVLLACLAAAGASLLVSYARARGEALGAGDAARVGGMQRPERVVLCGVACALSPLAAAWAGPGADRTLVAAALTLLAALTAGTAIRRTWSIYAALRRAEPRAARPPFRLAEVFRLEPGRGRRGVP
ncbi:MAG: CDP-alcohol phosphatidyltransferase family protein [Anaeromyxobacteraceae bacterium]